MNKISTNIKLLRIEKGINQEQLAEQFHGMLNWGYILYYIIRY